MIIQKIAEELNQQVGYEFYSAYLYLAMSAHSEFIGLKGFSHWFMVKYQEETAHAMKMYQYILSQGAAVKLLPIEQPPSAFESPLAMFEATLAHEQSVTKRINELVDLVLSQKDYATYIFLQWFVTEQIEEESVVTDIINKMKLVGNSGNGLFMIDNELDKKASLPAMTT